jgi:hypothetical protein
MEVWAMEAYGAAYALQEFLTVKSDDVVGPHPHVRVDRQGRARARGRPAGVVQRAPEGAAFTALLAELNVTKAQLLADTALLTRVLTYHVVPSRVLAAQVPVDTAITTVESGTFTVDGDLRITDERGRAAGIVGTDVFATNGVIHAIDRVILPGA